MTGTLTITPDPSSGGIARQLLRRAGESVRVLACFEDFTYGPLVPTHEPEALIRLRHRHWYRLWKWEGDGHRRRPQPPLRKTIMKAGRIDVLLGGSGREQLFLLAFADFLGAVDTDLGKIRLFQYPAQKSWYSLGMLNLDALAERPEPTLLTADTLDALRRIWRVICQPTPHGLFALCADDPGVEDFPNLRRGFAALVSPYPDSTTGLTLVEERLLKCMPGTWTASARVVGNAMIGEGEGPSIGDVILFHRLTGMADPTLPSPAVELRGDPSEMRSSEVRITDFGRACLKGEANHARTNGIDTWAGGVHLTAGNLWFRDPKGRLVAPV